jgi:hypothetical protein
LANIYTIYADHKDNITANEFVAKMNMFLGQVDREQKNECYRITR